MADPSLLRCFRPGFLLQFHQMKVRRKANRNCFFIVLSKNRHVLIRVKYQSLFLHDPFQNLVRFLTLKIVAGFQPHVFLELHTADTCLGRLLNMNVNELPD